jgi:hypothetical protein
MSKHIITLKNGGDVFLTLYSGASTWDEADHQLIDFKGWDDIDNIDIQTVDKLFGTGSYVVSKKLTEQKFSIKGRVNQPGVRSIREDISLVAEELTPITVTRQIVNLNGSESMDAFITGLEWNQETDEEAEFVISFKSTSAIKTIT